MTREELINAVKVKIEEFSPFEASTSTGLNIVTDTLTKEDSVRPIHAYIDRLLDEAARDVLTVMPISQIRSDSNNIATFARNTRLMESDGVGIIELTESDKFIKIFSVRLPKWYKAIHTAITPNEDPYLYEQQGNPYLRGKVVNPVVAIASGRIEMYSLPEYTKDDPEPSVAGANSFFTNINTCLKYVKATPAEQVQEDLQQLVAMSCAIKLLEIYNRTEAVRIMGAEYQSMLQGRLLANTGIKIDGK